MRGVTRAVAPAWSDTAAAAVSAGIHARGGGRGAVMTLLSDQQSWMEMLGSLELSAAERAAASEIMEMHAKKYAEAGQT